MLDVTHVTGAQSPFPPLSDKLSFKVAERKVAWLDKFGAPQVIEPQKALVGLVDDKPLWLANVGENYKVVHNTELFPYIEQHMTRVIDAQYLRNVTVREHTAYGGRDCYREYLFNDLKCDIGKGGDISFRLLVGNSYGAKAVTLMAGAEDGFCANGMIFGHAEKQARKHTSGVTMHGLASWVEGAVKQFAAYGTKLSQYNMTPVTPAKEGMLFDYLRDKGLLSDRMANRMREEMRNEARDRLGDTPIGQRVPNLWHLNSALTRWATHDAVRDTGNDHAANTRIQRTEHVARVMAAAEKVLA